MGKYIRKSKTTTDVSVMEVSQSSLGVRTRAKTLALQRTLSAATPSPSNSDLCYLQLRSRRLQKPLPVENSRKARHTGDDFIRNGESPKCLNSGSIEASFGENNLDSETRESRSTRESTPCSLIKVGDTISTPGSTTKKKCTHVDNQRTVNASPITNVPNARELDELFGHDERSKQLLFMEKYNFDVVNDLPLPGRYEWVRVTP